MGPLQVPYTTLSHLQAPGSWCCWEHPQYLKACRATSSQRGSLSPSCCGVNDRSRRARLRKQHFRPHGSKASRTTFVCLLASAPSCLAAGGMCGATASPSSTAQIDAPPCCPFVVCLLSVLKSSRRKKTAVSEIIKTPPFLFLFLQFFHLFPELFIFFPFSRFFGAEQSPSSFARDTQDRGAQKRVAV